ncbi:uncharacterized protein LOC114943993 [Nylanderia fulva]|uniref:uncharacterized protein LOC114943993 n=1 Tax=Nylanderia fulva TaxID=613905 RepID=UPI0010FB1CBC|nr:uncharacterized protein LOC114943993 [Nylanderia fulva]
MAYIQDVFLQGIATEHIAVTKRDGNFASGSLIRSHGLAVAGDHQGENSHSDDVAAASGLGSACPPDGRADLKNFSRRAPRSGERARASLDTVQGIKSDLEVHGFADASERAYAAVVYLRTRGVEGERRVFLLQAKTKVAPAQPVSLPRLELCAAALLAKLTAHVVKVMDIASAPLHLWSDSTVTLAWIQSHPSRWKTYVANRVADIQRRLPNAQWHHVSGAENPADCASRGLSPSDLPDHGLWWSGPPWLSGDATLPASTPLPMGDPQEERRQVHLAAVQSAEECPMLRRFSVLQRLLRVTAWCCRWLGERRVPYTPMSALSPQELEAARLRWIRHVQSWEFAEERRALSRGVAVPRRSVLARLDPFVDRNGVIRVGGRLKHAVLNPDERHPIILPRRSHFAVLVIRECHRRAMHGGVQLTLGMVRQGYWIPGGRLEVRHHIHRCVTCLRWRAASQIL